MNTILAIRLTILNNNALSTQQLVDLVQTAWRVWPKTQVRYIIDGKVIDGRGIMGVVGIMADWEDKLLIEACGPRARDALESISGIFANSVSRDGACRSVPCARAEWIEGTRIE